MSMLFQTHSTWALSVTHEIQYSSHRLGVYILCVFSYNVKVVKTIYVNSLECHKTKVVLSLLMVYNSKISRKFE